MECEGLLVYRLTMAFVQSPRPILVIDAERICGLLIYILVILIVVAICHLTTPMDIIFLYSNPTDATLFSGEQHVFWF